MTDHRPLDELGELASAHLDGVSTAEEAARVDADPEIQARMTAMGRIRQVMATPPPHSRQHREGAIAAALAAYDEEANPTPDVTPVTSRTWGRTPIVWRVVGVAAAVALLFAVVPMVASLLPSSNDTSQTAAPETTAPPIADDALSGPAAESSPESSTTAPAPTPPDPATTPRVASPSPDPTTVALPLPALGTFPTDAAVGEAVDTLTLQSTSVPWYASLPDPTSCVDELLSGLPPGAVAQLAATAVVAEQKVAVVAWAEDVRITGGDCSTVRVQNR